MSILHPLRTVIPRNNAGYIITTIWLVAGLASIPEPIFYLHGTYEDFQPSGNLSCISNINFTSVNGSQQLSNGTTNPSDIFGDKNDSYSANENVCNETVEGVYYCAPSKLRNKSVVLTIDLSIIYTDICTFVVSLSIFQTQEKPGVIITVCSFACFNISYQLQLWDIAMLW